MKNNLIIGATGFIGQHLLSELNKDNENYIIATGRNVNKINEMKLKFNNNVSFFAVDFNVDTEINIFFEKIKEYNIDCAYLLLWGGGIQLLLKITLYNSIIQKFVVILQQN